MIFPTFIAYCLYGSLYDQQIIDKKYGENNSVIIFLISTLLGDAYFLWYISWHASGYISSELVTIIALAIVIIELISVIKYIRNFEKKNK